MSQTALCLFPLFKGSIVGATTTIQPLNPKGQLSSFSIFNSMLNTNSNTLRRVVQADLNLQPHSSACWTAQLLSTFQGLRGCELYVRAVQTGHAITMQEFTAQLKHRMRG